MSRTEVEEIVATLVKEINMFGPAYEHTICGSYRYIRNSLNGIGNAMIFMLIIFVTGEDVNTWAISTLFLLTKMKVVS